MNVQMINKIVNGNINIDYDFKINKIKTNSKEVEEGDLFIAINKGHDYIDEAINNKASCIIIEQDKIVDIPTIKVESTINALGLIANYIRRQYDIPLIAIWIIFCILYYKINYNSINFEDFKSGTKISFDFPIPLLFIPLKMI